MGTSLPKESGTFVDTTTTYRVLLIVDIASNYRALYGHPPLRFLCVPIDTPRPSPHPHAVSIHRGSTLILYKDMPVVP